MVRAPCCEKMGLKRGPWSQEEDQILVDYINKHGHPNWRALPKLAGLLRCGKSCRLRWTNYLSPNIKRGNFSKEEEETIIQLHAVMGNRWSAIAARLPGRTDNEIKNVWHTHLKKRVKPSATNDANMSNSTSEFQSMAEESEPEGTAGLSSALETSYNRIDSPQPSCTDVSSVAASTNDSFCMEDNIVVPENFPEMDDEFWSEVFSGELPAADENIGQDLSGGVYESTLHDDMDFWFNVFTRGEELSLI